MLTSPFPARRRRAQRPTSPLLLLLLPPADQSELGRILGQRHNQVANLAATSAPRRPHVPRRKPSSGPIACATTRAHTHHPTRPHIKSSDGFLIRAYPSLSVRIRPFHLPSSKCQLFISCGWPDSCGERMMRSVEDSRVLGQCRSVAGQ